MRAWLLTALIASTASAQHVVKDGSRYVELTDAQFDKWLESSGRIPAEASQGTSSIPDWTHCGGGSAQPVPAPIAHAGEFSRYTWRYPLDRRWPVSSTSRWGA